MLDKYIILDREPNIVIKVFIYFLIVFVILLIYLSNRLSYTSYYSNNSYITFVLDDYYLKMDIPVNKLDLIINNNKIILDDRVYSYQIHSLEIGQSMNSQVIYLKIYDLDLSYKINNYIVKVMIKEREEKILNYLKEVIYG